MIEQHLLNPGDIITYKLGGGGGFFPPSERDPHLVLHDVRNGYVSAVSAREDYKIAIDEKSMTLNVDETNKRRTESREEYPD
jgi:N-methylhydantoinase B